MTEPHTSCPTSVATTLGQPGSFAASSAARAFAILTLLITLGCLTGTTLFSGIPLRDDPAILLDCARLIVHGWLPYVDYVEMNPPMAHYINVIPVYLASISGLEIPTVFNISVLLLAVYSASVLLFLLSRLTPVFSLSSRLVLTAVCLLFSLWVLRVGEFGQKDHLFALAFIPWLYCRTIRHGGGRVPMWAGIAIGLISGPLFFLKPHFCLMVALLEAWLLLVSHRFSTLWNPEIFALSGWAVAYAVHFCFLPSEMRDAFFYRWLPFIIANYDVYDHPMRDIAAQFSAKFWLLQVPVILSVLVLAVKEWLPDNWKLQLHGLVASALLAWGMFVVQHKGWTYHLLPAISFEMLLAATLAIMFLERVPSMNLLSRVGPTIRTVMFLLVCFCLSLLSIALAKGLHDSARVPDTVTDFVRVIEQQAAPDEKVAFISTSVSPAYPTLIYAKRLPGTRYLQAFPIAYLYKGARPRIDGSPPYRAPSEEPPEEQRFLTELGSDIIRRRPKLVFIDASANCQACPKGFRVEEYLTAVGWLQKFMKSYRWTGTLHGFAMYVRTD